MIGGDEKSNSCVISLSGYLPAVKTPLYSYCLSLVDSIHITHSHTSSTSTGLTLKLMNQSLSFVLSLSLSACWKMHCIDLYYIDIF